MFLTDKCRKHKFRKNYSPEFSLMNTVLYDVYIITDNLLKFFIQIICYNFFFPATAPACFLTQYSTLFSTIVKTEKQATVLRCFRAYFSTYCSVDKESFQHTCLINLCFDYICYFINIQIFYSIYVYIQKRADPVSYSERIRSFSGADFTINLSYKPNTTIHIKYIIVT